MTSKETTAIALKCFAIYILSQVITALPSYGNLAAKLTYMRDGEPSKIWILFAVLSIIIGIVTAILIWKCTTSLMTKETTPENSGQLEASDIMKIVMSCMGVYFIIDAVMVFPMALSSYQFSREVPNPNPNAFMFLVTQVLEFSFGALLIAKPGKWVKAIRSIGEKNSQPIK